MAERMARMPGWLSISGLLAPRRGVPEAGGLIEISGTGARLYMGAKYAAGDRLPLVINTQKGKVLPIPVRVVWVKKDEAGISANFPVRLRYLQELISLKVKVKGMAYGWLYGVRFEKDADPTGVKMLQKKLSEQRATGGEASFAIRVPDMSSGPDTSTVRP